MPDRETAVMGTSAALESPSMEPAKPLPGVRTEGAVAALSPEHREVLFGIFTGFYRELGGKWGTTVLADIWQGPNAVMVRELSASPMAPGTAISLISMLANIVQAKPEPTAALLATSGALEALYDLAFAAPVRLDLLPYETLAPTALTREEAAAWVRCCITLSPRQELIQPVVIRTTQGVHLFEFAALKQVWRDSCKFSNPMTRKTVEPKQLMRLTGTL